MIQKVMGSLSSAEYLLAESPGAKEGARAGAVAGASMGWYVGEQGSWYVCREENALLERPSCASHSLAFPPKTLHSSTEYS